MQKQKDVKRSEFSSLDIFLFSNGQQHSPPRKYNLRADELSWWEATLNNLARSQYGSNHTAVELYTVDGRPVQGPHELCAGAAYVAVEPPDLFLQCGYDKYLMKASRSWEKRQERKGNNGAILEPDKSDLNNKAEVKDTTSIQIYQDIRIDPISSTTVEEQIVVKPNSDIKSKTIESRIGSGKQLQRRKVSTPQQNPSILRKKYVNPVNPMTKKNDTLSKESSKVNTTRIKTESRVMKIMEKEISLLKSKTPGITQIIERHVKDSTDSCSSSQVAHEEFQGNQQPPTVVILGDIPENSQLKNDSNAAEKDDLSYLYNNEEHHQSIFISPIIPSSTHDKKDRPPCEPYDTEHRVIINSSVIDISEKFNYTQSQSEHVEMHRIEEETNITRATDAPETFKKKTIGASSQTVENIVVFVNQGENINLTLNIEIKNVAGSASVNIQNIRPSQSNATKSEREPQGTVDMIVDNGSLNRSYCEDAELKSWQPHSTQIKKHDYQFQETMNCMDMAICQCSDCSNSEKVIPVKADPIYFDKSNYFILLPAEKVKGFGCNCILEMKYKNEIHSSTNDKEILVVPKIIRDSVELLKDKFSVSKIDSKRLDCDQCPKCVILSTSIQEADRQAKDMATVRCVPVSSDVSDCKAKSPISPNIPKVFNDASTQTDWTNVLLEARLHDDDGRYSFHMPPLEMLKLYDAYDKFQ